MFVQTTTVTSEPHPPKLIRIEVWGFYGMSVIILKRFLHRKTTYYNRNSLLLVLPFPLLSRGLSLPTVTGEAIFTVIMVKEGRKVLAEERIQ